MPKVLLFNIHDADKRMKIRVAALRAGLEAVEVGETDLARPIGSLFGREGFAPAEEAERFSEEMLVMEMLSSPLLDAMRASGAAVALKAVWMQNVGVDPQIDPPKTVQCGIMAGR